VIELAVVTSLVVQERSDEGRQPVCPNRYISLTAQYEMGRLRSFEKGVSD
jgi:hypothetical protein